MTQKKKVTKSRFRTFACYKLETFVFFQLKTKQFFDSTFLASQKSTLAPGCKRRASFRPVPSTPPEVTFADQSRPRPSFRISQRAAPAVAWPFQSLIKIKGVFEAIRREGLVSGRTQSSLPSPSFRSGRTRAARQEANWTLIAVARIALFAASYRLKEQKEIEKKKKIIGQSKLWGSRCHGYGIGTLSFASQGREWGWPGAGLGFWGQGGGGRETEFMS